MSDATVWIIGISTLYCLIVWFMAWGLISTFEASVREIWWLWLFAPIILPVCLLLSALVPPKKEKQ
jgi:hypothetical protein